jgi:hypothetical protein
MTGTVTPAADSPLEAWVFAPSAHPSGQVALVW